MTPTLTALARHPVKSCRGHSVTSAVVEPWGLAGDRRWLVVNADGLAVTARTKPRMLLVEPAPEPDGLLFRAPGLADLRVPTPHGRPLTEVQVWQDRVKATLADDAAHGWLTEAIGVPVRLVYLDDPRRRPVDPAYSAAADRVSFADGYPMLLTSEASLAALNELVAAGPNAAEGPLPMIRFRPNLVIGGTGPWAEDGWTELRIGEARFRVAKACSRCVMTTVDPATAVKGREPLATLARHRRFGPRTLFGVNLIPDTPGVTVRVGDPVEVLGTRDGSEPLR
ncbi:MAG: MOSC domain-containing protein [Pseudonocardia sp.]|nr:MOSC domain-containing protein [Pseudonocardia sp.]